MLAEIRSRGCAPRRRRSDARVSSWLAGIVVRGCLLVAAAAAGLATAQVGSWTTTDPLSHGGSLGATPRTYVTQHLLGNGKVLVVGGGEQSTWLYNPAPGTWTQTLNDPNEVMTYHAGATLANGKVLIAGGGPPHTGHVLTYLYDPGTNLWSATDPLGQGRFWHASVRLANGKVLVIGGKTRLANGDVVPVATAEIYDPATGQWSATASMASARYLFPAVLLNNGKILVAGGYTGNNVLLASAELYDPATGQWSASGTLTDVVAEGVLVKLNDGRILLVGGKDALNCTWDVEIYNPGSGTWSPATRMRHARGGYHTLTLLPDGQVLAIGGVPPSGPTQFFNSSELYDPVNNMWTLTGPLAGERAGHGATMLPNGQVLVTAGFSAPSELYRPYLPRTVTDFNGDGKSDIVFESGAGTRWLFG